jgi:hypothetical protein
VYGTCEANDIGCLVVHPKDGRPPRDVPGGRCVRCGRAVCLNCSVLAQIRLGAGITLGFQRVCHDCGATYDALTREATERHLRFLGAIGVSGRVAPKPTDNWVKLVDDAQKAVAAATAKRERTQKREATIKRARPRAIVRRQEIEAPALPRPAPKALLEILGYAPHGK